MEVEISQILGFPDQILPLIRVVHSRQLKRNLITEMEDKHQEPLLVELEAPATPAEIQI